MYQVGICLVVERWVGEVIGYCISQLRRRRSEASQQETRIQSSCVEERRESIRYPTDLPVGQEDALICYSYGLTASVPGVEVPSRVHQGRHNWFQFPGFEQGPSSRLTGSVRNTPSPDGYPPSPTSPYQAQSRTLLSFRTYASGRCKGTDGSNLASLLLLLRPHPDTSLCRFRYAKGFYSW